MKQTWILVVAAALFIPSLCHAGAAMVGTLSFTNDTRQVTVSSNCATATQIMIKDSYISKNTIVNISSWTYLYIGSTTVVSPTTSFYVPSNSSFSPDGPMDAYDGQMYACSSATVVGVQAVPQTIGVFRAR